MNALRRGGWLAAVVLALGGSAVAAQAPTAPAAEEARRPRHSWTADRREFGVGDVITVLIDEYALATANRSDVAQDRRRRDLDLIAGGSAAGTALPSADARVGSINDVDSRQRGDAVRQNRFRTEMTVRVVGLEPGGRLRVEGRKVMRLDRGEQELKLNGVVRPEDVSTGNLIDSWRVADAELVYSTKGNTPKGGLLGRVLGAIWP